MHRSIYLAAPLLVLAACQTTATQSAAVDPEAHALAQAACAGCHSVERVGLSPNPDAPEWPVIANTPGLTRATLTTWLTDAHNYPEEMDFYLEEDEIDQLVTYLLTLQDADYHPPY